MFGIYLGLGLGMAGGAQAETFRLLLDNAGPDRFLLDNGDFLNIG